MLVAAYDYQTAKIVDEACVDIILVGDSGGKLMLGYNDNVSVTFDDMLHFCRGVARAASQALVIADMPFMTYYVSKEQALMNAARFIQEAHVDGVMVEGGSEIKGTVERLVETGIPVMGHIGVLLQKPSELLKAPSSEQRFLRAKKLYKDAKDLEKAGVFTLVLDAVPAELAAIITRELKIPVLGPGSGVCDGQALILHDLVGLRKKDPSRSHVKQYANLYEIILDALVKYVDEVRREAFPDEAHTPFHLQEDEVEMLQELIAQAPLQAVK